MTEPNVENLRRASMAVYLACEAAVADDIAQLLRWAADRIEAQETALRDAFTQPAAWRVDGIRDGVEHTWIYWKPEWPDMHAKEGDKVTPLYARALDE